LKKLPCDGAILDLEDAVSPAKKEEARELAYNAVKDGQFGPKTLGIRINSLASLWGSQDLKRAVESGMFSKP